MKIPPLSRTALERLGWILFALLLVFDLVAGHDLRGFLGSSIDMLLLALGIAMVIVTKSGR
jgi:hypothetical protein